MFGISLDEMEIWQSHIWNYRLYSDFAINFSCKFQVLI